MSDAGVGVRIARWIAACDRVPTAQRAVLGYYAETGTFDYSALELKSRVDSVIEEVLAELYGEIETALAREFDGGDVDFAYETKLTLPAELTLGYLFRRAVARAEGDYDPVADDSAGGDGLLSALPRPSGRPDGTSHRRRVNREAAAFAREAREMTAFVVTGLLDGDMRDAINDEEFEDFVVDFGTRRELSERDRRRVATTAQSCLQARVDARFDEYPTEVRAAYERAVETSEAHQEQDDRFRGLMSAAVEADDADPATDEDAAVESRAEPTPDAAQAAIEAEYKHRPMTDETHPFTDEELDLPYLTTQYDRVGVIYHGMFEMYRAAGFEIEPAFERSVVFAIIGAQVWLDDVDDYADDVAEGQLTPVTAEYLLADDDRTAYGTVVDVAEAYFDRARTYAEDADSTLTGIAVEYILRSGDVSHLPGADG